jgi:2-amino-4-hydroxy-6-hydroxymethyldihydropteridine diphosphokinase
MVGDDFLNMAVEVRCSLSPDELLHTVLEIEKQFGRRRNSGMGYQSRQLDIDIIHSYELVYQSNELCIPHPRLHLRKFALVPVKEISPDWVHPVLKKTCMELLSECGDDSKIEKLN